MCPRLQGDETLRYLCKCLLHRFRCHRPFLLQKDFSRCIQNAVARPVIAKVQTNREVVSFENRVFIYPNGASLFHSRSPFLLRHERVEHWERIASRGRPAFSSHLISRVSHRQLDSTPDKRGGLNGSTQHSARTHLALKTKAKSAR